MAPQRHIDQCTQQEEAELLEDMITEFAKLHLNTSSHHIRKKETHHAEKVITRNDELHAKEDAHRIEKKKAELPEKIITTIVDLRLDTDYRYMVSWGVLMTTSSSRGRSQYHASVMTIANAAPLLADIVQKKFKSHSRLVTLMMQAHPRLALFWENKAHREQDQALKSQAKTRAQSLRTVFPEIEKVVQRMFEIQYELKACRSPITTEAEERRPPKVFLPRRGFNFP